MSNRNKAEKTKDKSVNISIPNDIKEDDLKKILVDAILEAETKKKETEKLQTEKELCEWNEIIGAKEYNSSNKLINWIKSSANKVCVVFKIATLKKKDIKGHKMTSAFIKSLISIVLVLFAILLIIGAIISFSLVIYSWIPNEVKLPCYYIVLLIVLGVNLLLLSRFIIIASKEVLNIEDNGYLFGLFSSVTSVISIIIAVSAIFIKVG